MMIGALALDPVYDGYGHEPAREVLRLPGVDDPWAGHEHFLDEAGNLPLILGGFLLRTSDRVVLIDAGLGVDPALWPSRRSSKSAGLITSREPS